MISSIPKLQDTSSADLFVTELRTYTAQVLAVLPLVFAAVSGPRVKGSTLWQPDRPGDPQLQKAIVAVYSLIYFPSALHPDCQTYRLTAWTLVTSHL